MRVLDATYQQTIDRDGKVWHNWRYTLDIFDTIYRTSVKGSGTEWHIDSGFLMESVGCEYQEQPICFTSTVDNALEDGINLLESILTESINAIRYTSCEVLGTRDWRE